MYGRIERMAASETSLLARRTLLVASLLLAGFGLYRIGQAAVVGGKLRIGNPVSPLPEPLGVMPAPLAVRAEVTRVRGADLVRLGEICDFLVEQRPRDDQHSLYCNAQIICGGKLLYGGPDRGYFACRFGDNDEREVVGNDPTTTKQDKDAALHIDTRAGLLHIWDDETGVLGAFDLEAEVLEAN
jgi:hypothetical protein